SLSLFFFNAPSTTEIYTLSLHDALPISVVPFFTVPRTVPACADPAAKSNVPRTLKRAIQLIMARSGRPGARHDELDSTLERSWQDRKSTRLNSSHDQISYAVFCLKKKKK